jgi:hypothetical protein
MQKVFSVKTPASLWGLFGLSLFSVLLIAATFAVFWQVKNAGYPVE